MRTAIQASVSSLGSKARCQQISRKTAPTVSADSTLAMLKAVCERKPVEAPKPWAAFPRSCDNVLQPLIQLHASYLLASLPDAAAFLTCTNEVQLQLKPLAITAGAAQISTWLDITNDTANKPARLMSDDAHLQMLLVQLCHAGVSSPAQAGAAAVEPVAVQKAPMVLPDHIQEQADAKAEAAAGFADEFSAINWAAAVTVVEASSNATLKKAWASIKPVKLDGKTLTVKAPNRGSARQHGLPSRRC